MGSVGNFLFGGGDSTQTGQNNSTSSSNSSNSSQNTSVQAAQSGSSQAAANSSGSGNRSYGELNAALGPSLGYVAQGGNMLGALLGLPQTGFNYAPPAPSVMPALPAPRPTSSGSGTGSSMIDTLLAKYLTPPPPAPTPAPTPVPTPVPTPTPAPAPTGPTYSQILAMKNDGIPGNYAAAMSNYPVQARAGGGPVDAGRPYVVGENRPELFVPNQPGTIVPQVPGQGMDALRGPRNPRPIPGGPPTGVPGVPGAVPPVVRPPTTPPTAIPGAYNPSVGSPTNALDTFANSAGMNFILDQGQRAISGASAAGGTFNSGATGQALEQYGQNIGKTYLNDYMGRLLDYSKLGLGSASALSGAGGVSQGVGTSSGGANSSSFGNSSGTSSGSSTGLGSSSGSTSGNSNTKNGLLPALGSIGI